MFGRLQPTSSIQPIDHGSSRNIDDSTVTPTPSTNLTSPPPSPFRSSSLAQPTGALHPATLTPISTALPNHSARIPYPQPSNGHRHILPKPVLPTGGTITRPPTARLSNSAGLQGLADAAMMKEAQTGESLADRRLPPPRSSRPAYASHGRFWDEQLSQSRGRPIPPTTATPRPPSHQPSSTHAHSPAPSSPNPSRVAPPIRPIPPPSSATPTTSIAIPLLPKLPVGPRPFARPKFKTPHPLADIDLDREYNPPTVDEWEQRALKVLTLPPIPASWYPPAQQAAMAAAALQRNSVPSPAPGTTRSTSSEGCRPPNPTPPTTAISPKSNFPLAPAPIPFDSPIANPPSPASPISAISNPNSATGKAPRAKRGGDRRPRATPHSSVWAEAVTQLAPHDETGRRIHPPPDGSIPPPPNSSSRSDREMSEKSASDAPPRKSTSDPGYLADQSRSLAFEAHSTHRRASLRVQRQPGREDRRDSDSVASSRSSRSEDGRDSGEARTLQGPTVARSVHDAVLQLNVQLQLQGQTDRAGYRDSLAEKDQRIKELETALAIATEA